VIAVTSVFIGRLHGKPASGLDFGPPVRSEYLQLTGSGNPQYFESSALKRPTRASRAPVL